VEPPTTVDVTVVYPKMTELELAALLWDGLHFTYPPTNLDFILRSRQPLDGNTVRTLIRTALRCHGRPAVADGKPTQKPSGYPDRKTWCIRQVRAAWPELAPPQNTEPRRRTRKAQS